VVLAGDRSIATDVAETSASADPSAGLFRTRVHGQFGPTSETFFAWSDIEVAIQHWTEKRAVAGRRIRRRSMRRTPRRRFFRFGVCHAEGKIQRGSRAGMGALIALVLDRDRAACGDYRSGKIRWISLLFHLSRIIAGAGIASEEVAFTSKTKADLHFHLKICGAREAENCRTIPR